jgi:hypothetical protein
MSATLSTIMDCRQGFSVPDAVERESTLDRVGDA